LPEGIHSLKFDDEGPIFANIQLFAEYLITQALFYEFWANVHVLVNLQLSHGVQLFINQHPHLPL